MNNEEIQQLAQDRFELLPTELREAILSADLDTKIQAISKKNGLMINQVATLESAILLVLTGFKTPQEVKGFLTTEGGFPPQKADDVLRQADEEIFAPVKNHLEEVAPLPDNDGIPSGADMPIKADHDVSISEIENPIPTAKKVFFPNKENQTVKTEILTPYTTPRNIAESLKQPPTSEDKKENTGQTIPPQKLSLGATPTAPKSDPYRETFN
ncbi:MAG: hypothetical protein WCF94_01455 [bacterium]